MTESTNEQKEAVEWLRRCTRISFSSDDEFVRHRATILAMLAEPRLPKPEDVPDEVYEAMWWAMGSNVCLDRLPGRVRTHVETGREVYQKFYNHYTQPPTKIVMVWHVEYVDSKGEPAINVKRSKILALDEADRLRVLGVTNIRVVGPYQQEVRNVPPSDW